MEKYRKIPASLEQHEVFKDAHAFKLYIYLIHSFADDYSHQVIDTFDGKVEISIRPGEILINTSELQKAVSIDSVKLVKTLKKLCELDLINLKESKHLRIQVKNYQNFIA